MMIFKAFVTAAAVAAAAPAMAAPSGVSVDNPWIRATPPGAITAAGYMVLNNRGPAPDRLLGGSSPVARNVTIHQTVVSKDVSRMSATPSLPIGPGRAVVFKPGGYHLMLVGLKGPLTVGQTAPVTLNFEKAGPVTVRFTVRQPAVPAGGHDMHMDMH